MRKLRHASKAYRRTRPRNLWKTLYIIVNDTPVCFLELENFHPGFSKLKLTKFPAVLQEYCFGHVDVDDNGVPVFPDFKITAKLDMNSLQEEFDFHAKSMVSACKKLFALPPESTTEADILWAKANDHRVKATEAHKKISMISKLST